jgi:hypothetical protein
MVGQCRAMNKLTPEAFVFFYSARGIKIVRALKILSTKFRVKVDELYLRNAVRFFQDHFECNDGDANISSATPEMLHRLQSQQCLLLRAREASDRS